MKTARVPIRVVFYKEAPYWIAHCLEFDLLGSGETKRDALAMLAEAIEIQVRATIESGNIENLIRPADAKYFLMYAQGADVADGRLERAIQKIDPFEIEPNPYREFTGSQSELAL